MTDLTELKRLAEAATPGPWVARPGDGALDGRSRFETKRHVLIYAEDDCDTHPIADASCNHTCRMPEEQEDNAAFIAAANPATVLDLIAQIEHLTAERERDREAAAATYAAMLSAAPPAPTREEVARVLGKIDGATWTDTYVQFTTPEHNGPPEKYYRMADAILALLGGQS